MAKNILLFQTLSQFTDKRDNDYIEPWVSLTVENGKIDLNKSEREKLLGTPLTFEITGAGNVTWAGYPYRTIEYKKNDGEWTSITPASMSPVRISVVAGDVLQFRGDNSAYGDGYGTGDATCFYNFDYPTTAGFIVKGNIMSLVNSTGFTNLTTASSEAFPNMFKDCTGLTDASQLMLPATTVGNMSYYDMFYNCTSLTAAPELPATTIAQQCYQSMFYNCTSLTAAPELPATDIRYCIQCYESMFMGCTSLTTAPALPAMALTSANGCYGQMFKGCTSLTTAPALPATALTESCYGGSAGYADFTHGGMFEDCTSLTIAPELPATTLRRHCYGSMFKGCTGLTSAPDLLAPTLSDFCYHSMFSGCTNLSSVRCLATNFGSQPGTVTSTWLAGVSASGTFTKAASMADWSTGANGIPSGWDIVNE